MAATPATTESFACVHVVKTVRRDDPVHGVETEGRTVLDMPLNVTAPSAGELLESLERMFGVDLSDIEPPDRGVGDDANDDAERGNQYVDVCRNETDNSDEPTALDYTRWRGRLRELYIAEYSFTVFHRTQVGAAEALAEAAGARRRAARGIVDGAAPQATTGAPTEEACDAVCIVTAPKT